VFRKETSVTRCKGDQSRSFNRTRNKNTFDDEETVDSETELKGLQFERPRQSHASIVCRVI